MIFGSPQGAGRLHQMQDPHAEAVNVGSTSARRRIAWLTLRRSSKSAGRRLRAWKREVAGLHDRPRLSVEFEASGEIGQCQPRSGSPPLGALCFKAARNARACPATRLMPCPYIGLKLVKPSPAGRTPSESAPCDRSGAKFRLGYCRSATGQQARPPPACHGRPDGEATCPFQEAFRSRGANSPPRP